MRLFHRRLRSRPAKFRLVSPHLLLPLLVAGLAPTGCTHAASPATAKDPGGPHPITLPVPDLPLGINAVHSSFGAYLAGNIATYGHDDKDALAYYQAALIERPDSSNIAARTFVMAVLSGRFDVAEPLARVIVSAAPHEPLSNLLLAAQAVKSAPLNPADAAAALAHVKAIPAESFYQFAKPLAESWVHVASWHGKPSADQLKQALAAIDSLPNAVGLDTIRALHGAMIADLAGDTKTADARYREALQTGDNAFRIIQLYGNFLARHDRVSDAEALYRQFAAGADDRYGAVPVKVTADPPPLIRTPADGLAEAMFDLGSLLGQANAPDLALLSARLSLQLRPDLAYAQVLLANTLIITGRVDEAAAILHKIPPDTRLGRTAQLTTAQLLIARGKSDQATMLLKPLLDTDPKAIEPKIAYGDALNAQHRYQEAADYYRKALDQLGPDAPAAARGQLLFSLGVADEQAGHWPEAETTLRQAIKLTPDNPALLNYLGYALVIRDEKLPEAVKLIQAALVKSPKDGYYTDSLGWAYYHQHLYTKAAETLERAATYRAADPEINDHLGDAYWHAGRHEEARIAWRRALTYQPSPTLADTINRKLRGDFSTSKAVPATAKSTPQKPGAAMQTKAKPGKAKPDIHHKTHKPAGSPPNF